MLQCRPTTRQWIRREKWRPMHCEPQQCFVHSSWLHEIVCVGFGWFCSVLVWFSFGWPLCRSVRGLLQPQPLLPGGVAAGGTTGSAEGAAGDWEEAAGPSVPRLDPLKLESSLWSLWTSKSWPTYKLNQVESDVANTTIGCSVLFPLLFPVRC